MPPKSVLASKTLWINVLAAIAAGVQQFLTGWAIDPEWQGAILAIVNIILRLVTSSPVALKAPLDQDIPSAPRRVRRKIARELANSVTNRPNVLLAVGLALLTLTSCAGLQVRCDDPTLVLKDADLPTQTRLVFECGGQEIASRDVDLGELTGAAALCPSPGIVLTGKTPTGLSLLELRCGDLVLSEFQLDLRFLEGEVPAAVQRSALRPVHVVPVTSCTSAAPGPEVQP